MADFKFTSNFKASVKSERYENCEMTVRKELKMNLQEPSLFDWLIEAHTHIGLDRQGPGSSEMTLRALGFVDNLDANFRIVDLGCEKSAS